MSSFYSLSAAQPKGTFDFSALKGKVALFVNVASKCGKTKQYEQLEGLYKAYQPKGLVVLGFPSNQFKAQEPGSDEEIAEFCTLNYGVTFPIFKKADVNGPDTQPVYKYLKEHAPTPVTDITWNFDKFIVDKDGKVAEYFDRSTTIEELEAAVKKYFD